MIKIIKLKVYFKILLDDTRAVFSVRQIVSHCWNKTLLSIYPISCELYSLFWLLRRGTIIWPCLNSKCAPDNAFICLAFYLVCTFISIYVLIKTQETSVPLPGLLSVAHSSLYSVLWTLVILSSLYSLLYLQKFDKFYLGFPSMLCNLETLQAESHSNCREHVLCFDLSGNITSPLMSNILKLIVSYVCLFLSYFRWKNKSSSCYSILVKHRNFSTVVLMRLLILKYWWPWVRMGWRLVINHGFISKEEEELHG